METPFKQISLSDDDVLTRDVMDSMHSNSQWLYENTPRGRWFYDQGAGRSRGEELIAVSGRVHIPKSKKSKFDGKKVSLGIHKFSEKCRPVVTLGVVANDGDVFAVVNGIGNQLLPSSDGFEIRVYVPTNESGKWKISKDFYVCWQAVGYRDAS